jgi:hypothetical protein
MPCVKKTVTNNNSTSITFNYKTCVTMSRQTNINLNPGETKSFWLEANTFDTPFVNTNLTIIDGDNEPQPYSEPIQDLINKIKNPAPEESLPFSLGREYSPDARDNNYLISKILLPNIPKTVPITSRYWNDNVWWGDQGSTPQCVGYAWAHWIEDGPVLHTGIHPLVTPKIIYENAQRLDEWPGENYDGTSVRGGVKYLQNRRLVSSYYWAFDVNTLINTVLNLGPVVVGTNWYYNMFYPNRNGVISIGGRIAGGHAYVINGVDINTRLFRMKNSWGRSWGLQGHAYISFNDMSRLIREQGEICIATEIPS